MRRILLAGLIFAVIGSFIHMIEPMFTLKYYIIPQYVGVWSKVMMPTAGPPPPQFLILSFLFSYATGVVLAWFYTWVKKLLPNDYWSRVVSFFTVVMILEIVLWTIPTALLVNLPLAIIVSWTVSTILATFLATIAFSKILK